MTKQQVEKVDLAEKIEEPKDPELKASALQWQSEGFCWRVGLVRLNEQFVNPQVIHDHPRAFCNIQRDRQRATRKLDRLTLIAHDEAWLVDAVVAAADHESVTLAYEKIITLPARTEVGGDAEHEIRWSEGGYRIFRRRDGIPMSAISFQTIEQATLELARMSPRKVG